MHIFFSDACQISGHVYKCKKNHKQIPKQLQKRQYLFFMINAVLHLHTWTSTADCIRVSVLYGGCVVHVVSPRVGTDSALTEVNG